MLKMALENLSFSSGNESDGSYISEVNTFTSAPSVHNEEIMEI